MKHLFFVSTFFISIILYGQTQNEIDAAKAFVLTNDIKFNKVSPPNGFKVFYNCDSILFMRGNFKDTIKIWTPSMEEPQEIDKFQETLKDKNYGTTVFAKELFGDGRITVEYYHQTEFIYRNDSLFQIVNITKFPIEKLTQLFQSIGDEKISQEQFDKSTDSLSKAYEKISVFRPKLIFAKNMFKGKNKKVKINKKLNFFEDVILLERKWNENKLSCYTIRINNDKENTSYSYSFNEKLDFILWQNCNTR